MSFGVEREKKHKARGYAIINYRFVDWFLMPMKVSGSSQCTTWRRIEKFFCFA